MKSLTKKFTKTKTTRVGGFSFLVCPKGVEPPFSRIGICCTIRLCYIRKQTIIHKKNIINKVGTDAHIGPMFHQR